MWWHTRNISVNTGHIAVHSSRRQFWWCSWRKSKNYHIYYQRWRLVPFLNMSNTFSTDIILYSSFWNIWTMLLLKTTLIRIKPKHTGRSLILISNITNILDNMSVSHLKNASATVNRSKRSLLVCLLNIFKKLDM